MTAMMIAMSMGMNAQTVQKQVVEEGGTGPFKSEVVGDASCRMVTGNTPVISVPLQAIQARIVS